MQSILTIVLLLPLVSFAKVSLFRFSGAVIEVEERKEVFTLAIYQGVGRVIAEFSKDGNLRPRNCIISRYYRPANSADNFDDVHSLIATLRKLGVSAEKVLDLIRFSGLRYHCMNSRQRTKRQANNNRAMLIYPGTKWCGKGNIATSDDDLGEEYEADECCRNHDRCRNSIVRGQTYLGYTNNSPFTINSCACDENFKTCLQDSSTVAANNIGELFFNKVGMVCYKVRRVCRRNFFNRCVSNSFVLRAYPVSLPRWEAAIPESEDY